jgi:CHASE3 domain sensor protein
MSTAVQVDEDAKSKLEELQAEIKLKTGKKVTQQEILTQLIESAVESKTEFVDSFRDGARSLSEREIEALNQGRFASGVETDEEDIDEILYGRR